MIKKAPQKSPTSPQSRRSRVPVRSAVSAIPVSPKAPAATDTCANQPPAVSPLPPNNSKSSRRRTPATNAPTHHGKPLYAGVADTGAATTSLAAPTASPATNTPAPTSPTLAAPAPTTPYAGVADTGAATSPTATNTSPAAQTASPAAQTATPAPTSLTSTLAAFDLALWLKQRTQKADPLFWLAFTVAFAALNLIFLFHGAHFLFGDHDWKYLKPGLSLGAGLFEGRFAQFLPINILSGGDILPIVNNILGFAGFSLGVALLARYWRLPRQKSAWLLFALFTAVTPYILSFMYFAFLIIPVLGWSAFVLGSLLISEKEMRFSPIRSLSAIALATLALGGYPPVVNLMAVALAVRLLFAALFEGESARGLWRRYRWTAINLLLTAICCKLCLWGLGKIGAMNTAYYNLQTTPLAEWGNKFLLVSHDLWQQFTVTLPFIDTPYKTAAGLVAACGVVSFTRLLIAPKSDAAPNQPIDHQAHPFYSPSQSVSSSQPSIHQATPAVVCPVRATAPTKSDAAPNQPIDHQAHPFYSPSQSVSSSQPSIDQATPAVACPCPAGQPTPTAAAPLSPSSLSLNPTSPDQPADKCGSSAFAPSGQNLSSNPLLPTPPLESSIHQATPAVACPAGQNISATPPLPSAAPEPSDHQAHPAPYTTRTTAPANRISQTALLLLLFVAVLYAPLLTLFISTSLAETEFSPRIDFFGLMYFYAAMFALTLKAAAPVTPAPTSDSQKKSDASQPADHQAHPFCSPSQSDSSRPTNQPPSATPGACHKGLPPTSDSPKKSDASQPADQHTHTLCPPSQSISFSQSSSRQTRLARVCPCPAGQPTPTAAAPLSPSSLPLNRTDSNQSADKCGSSAFAPSGLFPRIRHKIKCLFAHPTPITNISQSTSRQMRLTRICPEGQNISTTSALPSVSPEPSDHQAHSFCPPSQSISSSQPSIHQATPAVACPVRATAPTKSGAAPASPVSPISQALKNLATAAAIAAIAVSANNLFDAQKVWKLGFDAEMKLYRRAAARFMSSPDFLPGARYIMVQGGSPSFRPRFYHTPYKRGSDDLLNISYVPGMNPAVMWNYYGVTEYGDPKAYVYTFRPTTSDAEIIRRAAPWPSPESVKVINIGASPQNWIMLIMPPNGHAAVKNTYGL